jgi:hypothetical protein
VGIAHCSALVSTRGGDAIDLNDTVTAMTGLILRETLPELYG